MVGAVALDECHGLTEAGDVGAEDAFDEFVHRIGAASYASQVGIDHRLGSHALIDLEPEVGWIILWVV